ncbi:molybdopterin-binding protein [Salinarimonas chemoclinalis]|uniref:molybdopterin-binding protein n=1 Tax=Salinarimonas chemoclinalis TaxID=3241599 RepID=UPI003556B87C
MTPTASPTPLVPLPVALARWLDGVRPVAAIVCAPADAVGAALAQDVFAPADVPAAARARRAGFAVAAADTIGASPYAPGVCATPPARIAAGAPLPPGSDAVLPEGALSQGPIAEFLAEVAPGTDVRRAGDDARAGAPILRAGHRLRASDASVLAALGVATVAVRRPRIRLDGVARLAPLVTALGGEVAEGEADLVLVRGGDAHGGGGPVVADGLALRPGETARLARDARGALVLHLPALESDALGAALALVPEALAALADGAPPAGIPIRLAAPVTSTVGLAEIVLLAREGDGRFVPLAAGDLGLAAFARADFWALVPPDAEGYADGAILDARPLP